MKGLTLHDLLASPDKSGADYYTDEFIGALVEDDLERRYNERFPYPPPEGWQLPEPGPEAA